MNWQDTLPCLVDKAGRKGGQEAFASLYSVLVTTNVHGYRGREEWVCPNEVKAKRNHFWDHLQWWFVICGENSFLSQFSCDFHTLQYCEIKVWMMSTVLLIWKHVFNARDVLDLLQILLPCFHTSDVWTWADCLWTCRPLKRVCCDGTQGTLWPCTLQGWVASVSGSCACDIVASRIGNC